MRRPDPESTFLIGLYVESIMLRFFLLENRSALWTQPNSLTWMRNGFRPRATSTRGHSILWPRIRPLVSYSYTCNWANIWASDSLPLLEFWGDKSYYPTPIDLVASHLIVRYLLGGLRTNRALPYLWSTVDTVQLRIINTDINTDEVPTVSCTYTFCSEIF